MVFKWGVTVSAKALFHIKFFSLFFFFLRLYKSRGGGGVKPWNRINPLQIHVYQASIKSCRRIERNFKHFCLQIRLLRYKRLMRSNLSLIIHTQVKKKRSTEMNFSKSRTWKMCTALIVMIKKVNKHVCSVKT